MMNIFNSKNILTTPFSLLLISLFISTVSSKYDDSTYSNYNELETSSISLNLNINFYEKMVIGTVDLYLKSKKDALSEVILDTLGLEIFSVVNHDSGESLDFYIKNVPNSAIGLPLVIKLNRRLMKYEKLHLVVYYRTTQEGSSVQWLTPEMTYGGKLPYMFTQNEPIYARSLLPCQDTPLFKVKVKAVLTVRDDLKVVFGGKQIGEATPNPALKTLTFTFEQNIPIPTYLIAFAAGEIVNKKVSDQIYVYTEPSQLDKVHAEFSECQKFITAAESYMFDYEWGMFNILVLPKAFPYGGMENPNLTFATPSIIVGDKSLTNVIAHELSHSWTGNLVTNSNWDNFWLNEGFTVFFERKIIQIAEKEKNEARKLHSEIGFDDLTREIEKIGKDSTYSSLFPRVGRNNPDDAFSIVPYEKGYTLLYKMETLLGEDKFKTLFVNYIKKNIYSSVETDDFKNMFIQFVNENFDKDRAKEINDEIKWDEWLYTPGMPPANDYSKNAEYNN